ncbi:MAG: hypothetical protein L0H41_09220 [Microlunatus sp.]|nr:hypothetical protein [Microlunatus sp.]MDN5804003.1 hypothetical protein [Microlunatus sp.]
MAVVLDNLEAQGVGALGDNGSQTYFRGVVPMKQGTYRGVVFFLSQYASDAFLVLGGSQMHLRGQSNEQGVSNSGINQLVSALRLANGPHDSDLPAVWDCEAQQMWLENEDPPQWVEFVAERILTNRDPSEHFFVRGEHEMLTTLATPIYVATASAPSTAVVQA